MSGIAAIWRLDGAPLARTTLDRVTERLAPAVPDAAGCWLDGPVGLGHRALHATPQSLREKLPLAAEAGDVVVTADARLDNRSELLPLFGLDHRPAEEIGDAELVLRAWERWGEECPAHLLGDFSIALWDGRRRVLFCARDPAGVRPLYYHLGPRLFAIASEVAALLAIPEVPRRLDEVRIAAFLVPGLDARSATFYEGIRRLPAGHRLTVDTQGGAPRPYWQLDPARELHFASDATYGEAFRELFTDAVRQRLRSAFPVAAALSGGLDSSSVVCVARTLGQQAGDPPLLTYTARFPTIPRCDEGAYVAAVETQGGLTSRHLRGDTLDPLGDLEDARPESVTLHAPGYYMHRALYHAARADGARVFLEGIGGDHVVSHGLGHLHDLARHGRWLALGREARVLARTFQWPTWRALRVAAGGAASPALRRAWWRLRHGGLPWPRLLRAEFAERIGLADRLRAADATAHARGGTERTRHDHWRRLTSGRLPTVLESLAAAAGAAGVEVRDPFLDRRLMEFCLAIPASQKIRQGRTRVVTRHALESLLPREIRERPDKAPINLMLNSALVAYGPERLARLMAEAREILAPYVRPGAVDRAHRGYVARGAPRDVRRVWALAILTLWLRRAAR